MSEIIERLRQAIDYLETTPNAFANKANISPSNFGKMLKGKQKITARTIDKICAAHYLSAEWLKHGTKPMITEHITKGNFDSPDAIYAEGSQVVIGDAVLTERVKLLERIIAEKDERIAELKERIEELKTNKQ